MVRLAASGNPWVRGISVHTVRLSSSDASVADLVALVVDPEELDLLVTLILERKRDSLIPGL